uniref:THAP-type domain-containing protein n=1 Tax=Schizaphis graminum TaxID=13262 RepID=A0A2S2N9C6_SCHGA
MVSNKCCVPGCQQSSSSKFGVPQNDHKAWEKKIGIVLNRNSRVCAHHFNTNDIISTWTSGEGSSKYSVSKQIIIYCICDLEITTLVVSSLSTFYLSFFITYTLKMSISF